MRHAGGGARNFRPASSFIRNIHPIDIHWEMKGRELAQRIHPASNANVRRKPPVFSSSTPAKTQFIIVHGMDWGGVDEKYNHSSISPGSERAPHPGGAPLDSTGWELSGKAH